MLSVVRGLLISCVTRKAIYLFSPRTDLCVLDLFSSCLRLQPNRRRCARIATQLPCTWLVQCLPFPGLAAMPAWQRWICRALDPDLVNSQNAV